MICICGLYQYQSSRFLPSAAPALAESDLPHQYPVFSKVSLIPRARGGHPKSNKLLKLELRTSNFRSDPLHKNRPYKKKHTHTHRTGHIPLKPARPVPLFLIFPGEEQPIARHEICQREHREQFQERDLGGGAKQIQITWQLHENFGHR